METVPINTLSASPKPGFSKRFFKLDATVFQLWKFACVGAVATLIQFSILILLVQLFGVNPVVASVTGYLISLCFNYHLNYKFTFKATTPHKKTIVVFGVTMGAGLVLNASGMSLCLNVLHLRYVFAQVVATGCVFVWNFAANKLWTFRAAALPPADRAQVMQTAEPGEDICPK